MRAEGLDKVAVARCGPNVVRSALTSLPPLLLVSSIHNALQLENIFVVLLRSRVNQPRQILL